MTNLRFLLSKATPQSTIEFNVNAAKAMLDEHEALVRALRWLVECVVQLEGTQIQYSLALEMGRALREAKDVLAKLEQ